MVRHLTGKPLGVAAATAVALTLAAAGCGGDGDGHRDQLQGVIDGMSQDVFVGNGITGQRQLFHLPGAALTVDSGSGDVETFTSGAKDLESRTDLEGSEIQPIGSNTKVVTAVLVMRLVEQGKLAVDDRITDLAARYRGDGGALQRLVDRYRDRLKNVRLHELLNHTSGLADALDSKAFFADFSRDPLGNYSLTQLASFGLGEPPVFAPGAPGKWNYSNTDYFLLGMVLEAVAGQPVRAQMESLFEEAGMDNSYYSPSPAELKEPPIAGSLINGYMPGTGPNAKQPTIFSVFDGAPTATARLDPAAVKIVSTNPSESGPTVRVSAASAAEADRVERQTTFSYKDVTHAYTVSIGQTAGGIVSNTKDLARFYRALFEGELVDESTLAQMEQTVPTGENSKGVVTRWGFGFGQQRIAPSVLFPGSPRLTVWMHLGDIFGWESAAYYVEEEDLVVTNVDNLFPTPVGDLGLLRDVLQVELEGD